MALLLAHWRQQLHCIPFCSKHSNLAFPNPWARHRISKRPRTASLDWTVTWIKECSCALTFSASATSHWLNSYPFLLGGRCRFILMLSVQNSPFDQPPPGPSALRAARMHTPFRKPAAWSLSAHPLNPTGYCWGGRAFLQTMPQPLAHKTEREREREFSPPHLDPPSRFGNPGPHLLRGGAALPLATRLSPNSDPTTA